MRRTFVASTLTLALTAMTATVLAASPATANHQPGVTYVGQILSGNFGSPPLEGPRVEIDVAADGSAVTRFEVINATFPNQFNPACGGSPFNHKWVGVMPITNPPGYYPDYHYFSNLSNVSGGQVVPFEFDGSFEPGTASGRFTYRAPDFPDPGCGTLGNVAWVASAPGGCLGSPEYVGAQAKIASLSATMATLKKKMKKAKKAERWKKHFKLKKKYKKAYSARQLILDTPIC